MPQQSYLEVKLQASAERAKGWAVHQTIEPVPRS